MSAGLEMLERGICSKGTGEEALLSFQSIEESTLAGKSRLAGGTVSWQPAGPAADGTAEPEGDLFPPLAMRSMGAQDIERARLETQA